MDKRLSNDFEAARGLLALGVCVCHSMGWFLFPVIGSDNLYFEACSMGAHIAVLLFLILSGYVIAHSLLGNWQANGFLDGKRFLVARAMRILPPFAFAFLLSLAVGAIILIFKMHGSTSFRLPLDYRLPRENVVFIWRDVLATGLLSNGIITGTGTITTNGPLWTLSVEVWMYLIALLIGLGWDKIHRRTGDAYLPLLGLGMILALLIFQYRTFQQYSIFWFLGAALRLRPEFPRLLRFLPQAMGAAALFGFALMYLKPGMIFPLVSKPYALPGKMTFVICVIALFVSLRKLIPIGKLAPLRWLGSFSYTLYVIHFPLYFFLFSLVHPQMHGWSSLGRLAFFIVLISGSLGLSYVSAYFLEDKEAWQRRFHKLLGQASKRDKIFELPQPLAVASSTSANQS